MLNQNLKTRIQARWRNLEPVWNFNTRKARKLYKDNYKILFDSIDTPLKKNGIVIVNNWLDNLEELQNYRRDIKTKYLNSIKRFLFEYWQSGETLNFNNPFVNLALSENVLAIVSNYLGCWPILHDYRLWETRLMKEKGIATWSQTWHRDPEDKKLLNIFIYLNDVEDYGTGPFQYIPGSHIEGPYWKVLPQVLPPTASYPGKENVEKLLGDKIISCYGKAGTVILADTSGLHRGGYSTTKPRLMFKALYTTTGNFGNNKPRYKLPAIIPAELTKQQKFAIGLC